MITIVWQSADAPTEETITWAEASRDDFESLVAAWRTANPNAILSATGRVTPDGPPTERILRVSLIRDIRWDD